MAAPHSFWSFLFRPVARFRLLVAVILLTITAGLARYPAHNGDLPFYIAAAFNLQGMDDSSALRSAAAEISRSLPAAEAVKHLENLRSAPPGFLDFYRMKAGYTNLIVLFHRCGFSYVSATVVPSLLAFLLLGWGVFSWIQKLSASSVAVVTGLALLFYTAAFQLGRMSTPDAPAQCLLFWSVCRIRFGRGVAGTLGCLFISLVFRPDNLPAVAGLLVLMRFYPFPPSPGMAAGQGSLPWAAVWLALLAAVGCCVALNAWTEPRFWWFRPVPYPGVINVPDPALLRHFARALARGPFPVLLAVTGLLYTPAAGPLRPSRERTALLLFLYLMFVVRYLLFPHYEERFFVAVYLAGLLMAGEKLAGSVAGDQ